MLGANRTMFCSPQPKGIWRSWCTFCMAVPMMSPGGEEMLVGLVQLTATEINNNFHSVGRVRESLAGVANLSDTTEISNKHEVLSAE